MGKTRVIALLFLLTTFVHLSIGSPEQTLQNKNILILLSLAPTTPACRPILDGIRTQPTMEFGDAYNLHVEYLESERYPKGNYPRERIDLYNKKYTKVDLDLLICIGTDILSILKNQLDSQLLNLPTVSPDYDFSNNCISTEISLNK